MPISQAAWHHTPEYWQRYPAPCLKLRAPNFLCSTCCFRGFQFPSVGPSHPHWVTLMALHRPNYCTVHVDSLVRYLCWCTDWDGTSGSWCVLAKIMTVWDGGMVVHMSGIEFWCAVGMGSSSSSSSSSSSNNNIRRNNTNVHYHTYCTYFNYLDSEAVLYIGKFNSHLTESNLSLLKKPIS